MGLPGREEVHLGRRKQGLLGRQDRTPLDQERQRFKHCHQYIFTLYYLRHVCLLLGIAAGIQS